MPGTESPVRGDGEALIRGVIFDADGTLLDSMHGWQTLGERYLRSLGLVPRENLEEVFRTFTLDQSARYYIDHYGVTLSTDEITAGLNSMIEKLYTEEAQLRPGVRELLQKLRAARIPMVVATASDRRLVEAALRRCGVWSCFETVITCREAGSKSSPHIFETARSVLGTPRADTWVFEDALHAAATAAGAGFPVLGVRDPSEKDQEGLREISTIYIENFTKTGEILRFFSLEGE